MSKLTINMIALVLGAIAVVWVLTTGSPWALLLTAAGIILAFAPDFAPRWFHD